MCQFVSVIALCKIFCLQNINDFLLLLAQALLPLLPQALPYLWSVAGPQALPQSLLMMALMVATAYITTGNVAITTKKTTTKKWQHPTKNKIAVSRHATDDDNTNVDDLIALISALLLQVWHVACY